MLFETHNNKTTITRFILLTALFIFLPCFVLASSTDGTIDSTYKYAWSDNAGSINFGATQGNVHITDSELTGYAWSENTGWINLNTSNSGVVNDGAGNLSGYAWSQNMGWINFAPTNGGVAIDSNGEFSGTAFGESIGWIFFNDTYKVQTDWRPQSARPACNNALDDDSDGLIDYPADLGCESLTDDNEINPGGLPPSISNPPQDPAPTETNPQGGFKILINNGDEYANNETVELKLFGGSDTAKMSISNSADFKDATQIPFQAEIGWELKTPQPPFAKGGKIETVYAKFYTQYGQPSDVVSDTIILKEEAATATEKAKEFAEKIVNIATEAVELIKANISSLLAKLGIKRDLVKETNSAGRYVKNLIKDSAITKDQQHALTNFIAYGTNTTLSLGEGERAGVVNSYKSAFGKLPNTEDEWSDVVKIANGRWSKEISETAEANAVATFKKIYLREPNRTNPNDDAAVVIMAYGLRPIDRNLDSEKAAVKIFKNIYNYSPISAADWDAARAVAYSGAVR